MDVLTEPVLRAAAFVGVLTLMGSWEALAPRRKLNVGRGWRWTNNLAIVVVDTIVLRALFPLAGVGVALFVEEQGWGLFNAVRAPAWLALTASVVALDLVIYAQHVLFHRVPLLWRLHRMHHADLDIDASTGLRFHPFEIVASMLIKFAAIAALGAPALAVLIFEVLLNASSMFNHGNVRLPARVDALVRRLVVTPDMHRVHHSVVPDETHSNFGFNLALWDRLFGTYRAQPAAGHEGMTIGLPIFRNPDELRLDRLLTQPFRDDAKVG